MQPQQFQPKYPHPLAGDDPYLRATILDDLKRDDPNGTIEDLLFERTHAASAAWNGWLTARERIAPEADRLLLASLLAAYEMHRQGITWHERTGGTLDDHDRALLNKINAAYDRKDLYARAYRIDPHEMRAVEAYSDARKAEKMLGNTPNPRYMGNDPLWGDYGDGWAALAMVMRKIPTLGRLGLEMTTYRAPRAAGADRPAELEKLSKLAVETEVQLGVRVMNMAQRHYLSTAVTYNQHWDRAPEVGGLIGVTGSLGCYINPFGLQTWVDGAEVLYPPMMLTVFEGLRPEGLLINGHTYPVAHLREVAQHERGQAVVDDSQYAHSATRQSNLDERKLRMVAMLDEHDNQAAVQRALAEAGVADKSIMYLTYDELIQVHQRLSGL
jgi:hypothetical protein